MSQAGIVDFEGSHPQVPTLFVSNVGSAVPIGNTLEILGTIVAAHGVPFTGPQLSSVNTSVAIGTQGDNAVSAVWLSTSIAAADVSLSVPAYRIAISSTTTVYLVAEASFSAGTGKAYGRISATRVG